MIKYIFFIALLSFATSYKAQSNKGKSGVSVESVKTQSVLGSNLGYYVQFKNNSSQNVDGLKWTATFTDNFGKVLGTRSGQWQSGNFISAKAWKYNRRS
jgi:hypothetical protein